VFLVGVRTAARLHYTTTITATNVATTTVYYEEYIPPPRSCSTIYYIYECILQYNSVGDSERFDTHPPVCPPITGRYILLARAGCRECIYTPLKTENSPVHPPFGLWPLPAGDYGGRTHVGIIFQTINSSDRIDKSNRVRRSKP